MRSRNLTRRGSAALDVDDLARRRLDALLSELAGEHAQDDLPGSASRVWPDQEAGEPEAGRAEPTPAAGAVGRHAFRPLPPGDRWGGWVEDRLPDSWRGRVRLGSAQVGALALVLAVGVLLAAWQLSRGSEQVLPTAAPVVQPPPSGVSSPPATDAQVPTGSPGPMAADGSQVVVDVQGAVRRPGIVVLPTGSRVVDALDGAGGYTGPKRRLRLVNLARPLVDGEQILAGRAQTPVAPAAGTGSTSGTPSAGQTPLVSLNTADQTALETLPGVGPVTAAAILQWRADHGPFTSVDQLIEVSGIGEKTLAQIAPFVTL